jgi:hypothetical protein
LVVLLLAALRGPVLAGPQIQIVVKTIMAVQGAPYIDPSLSGLIQELQPIFRCPTYRLLTQDSMSLKLNETGTASLPNGRVLKITPLRIKGNRVALRLAIQKRGRQIFETSIRLLNRGTVTVGWPEYKGGALLFNIFGSF